MGATFDSMNDIDCAYSACNKGCLCIVFYMTLVKIMILTCIEVMWFL